MQLTATLDELSKARRYVLDGANCVLDQRKVVERLERRGQDALNAILFLEYLEEMQEQYVSHRDRIEQQLLGMLRPVSD
jgi:hypothetical protein